jgi:hypothetical protein
MRREFTKLGLTKLSTTTFNLTALLCRRYLPLPLLQGVCKAGANQVKYHPCKPLPLRYAAATCRPCCREFAKLGLTKSVGGVLALALSRELTPVVTSIIVAGRVGSAFAAELGTMQASWVHVCMPGSWAVGVVGDTAACIYAARAAGLGIVPASPLVCCQLGHVAA